jgi:malonyl-CoA decarboxylase
VTLSPVPGFVRWLREAAEADPAGEAAALVETMGEPGWYRDDGAEAARPRVLALAAQYLLDARRPDGQPPDPVARFHLGNGAELAAIHWPADTSPNGLERGAGVMVNYRYRLDRIEENHEAYAAEGKIASTRAVRALRAA